MPGMKPIAGEVVSYDAPSTEEIARQTGLSISDIVRFDGNTSPRALPSSCPVPLRAIVTKALAPHPAQRYGSAAAFQSDLQAFLEHKPPVAELERRSNWSATATLAAARAALRRVTRAGTRVNQKLRLAGALAWFAGGMLLWIGGSYAWQLLQSRAAAAAVERIADAQAAICQQRNERPVPLALISLRAGQEQLTNCLIPRHPW